MVLAWLNVRIIVPAHVLTTAGMVVMADVVVRQNPVLAPTAVAPVREIVTLVVAAVVVAVAAVVVVADVMDLLQDVAVHAQKPVCSIAAADVISSVMPHVRSLAHLQKLVDPAQVATIVAYMVATIIVIIVARLLAPDIVILVVKDIAKVQRANIWVK